MTGLGLKLRTQLHTLMRKHRVSPRAARDADDGSHSAANVA